MCRSLHVSVSPGAAHRRESARRFRVLAAGDGAARRRTPLASVVREEVGMRRKTARGFTLVEMAVVLGIVAALSALAYDGMRRARPRATYGSTVADVQSLLHVARQQAFASGASVGVLIFPSEQTSSGVGRIVVLQDTPIEQGPSFFT